MAGVGAQEYAPPPVTGDRALWQIVDSLDSMLAMPSTTCPQRCHAARTRVEPHTSDPGASAFLLGHLWSVEQRAEESDSVKWPEDQTQRWPPIR